MIAAATVQGRQAVGPRLRRPLFGGTVTSPLAVTDNHGHARWMDRVACIGNSIVPQIPVMFFDWMREVTRSERYLAA